MEWLEIKDQMVRVTVYHKDNTPNILGELMLLSDAKKLAGAADPNNARIMVTFPCAIDLL